MPKPTFCLLRVFLLLLGTSAAAAAPCPKDQRQVPQGTAVYGGPGLGYKVIEIVGETRCRFVRENSADGSFAMIELSANRVGWIATGLVDVLLNEDTSALPSRIAEEERVILLDAAIRVAPRVDATATRILPKGTQVVLEGESSNGLWVLVNAGGVRGWIPRYQSAASIPAPGDSPAATSGPWHVREGYVPPGAAKVAKASTSATAVGADSSTELDTGAKRSEEVATAPPLPAGTSTLTRPTAAQDQSLDDTIDANGTDAAARTGPTVLSSLGRSLELSLGAGAAQWSQNYISDAQNDPFYRYQLATMGGFSSLQVAWRGQSPLSLGLHLSGGGFGFEAELPEADDQLLQYLNAAVFGASVDVGWRLTSTAEFDVETGVGLGFSLNWFEALTSSDGEAIPALLSATNVQVLRPRVSVRRRLGDGRWGQLYVQLAMPFALFSIWDDPGARYSEAWGAGAVQPPANNAKPGDNQLADGTSTVASTAPSVHLSLGFEGSVRYSFPVTDSFFLYVEGAMQVAQAWIQGPGLRWQGAYSIANQTDLVGNLQAGLTLTF